jgi:DNA-directed RNA polymerase sigma subunit (sigma70/sigma32)
VKNPFEHIPNSELSLLIDEWIKNERNRKLMKRRFIDGITVERIAEEFDLSAERTRVIIKHSKNDLKNAINQS